MPVESMRQRFLRIASALVEEDDRVALVVADISVSAFAANGIAARHPDRVINVGIREQALIGVSAGLALEGLSGVPPSGRTLWLCGQGVGGVTVVVLPFDRG